ncbi:hypothetical protein [Perlucidibaca aquatica]|uniref:hypothetical protein n=1 Tax=Perlucidibaca aquatica TaxID=1852776 RepID=UPI000839E1F5|nr:hypothetical protein [Perlucidibaca aquatica]
MIPRAPWIAAALVLALTACSSPHDVVVPTDIAKWETELKPAIEDMSEEEKNLLAAYLMRIKMAEAFGAGSMKEGLTVGEALKQQKAWVEEQKAKEAEARALKERVEAERAALKKLVDQTLTVAVVGLELRGADYSSGTYSDSQIIKLALQNKGKKDIRGVKGEMKFIDIFDKEVGSITFGYDDGIPAGQTRSWTGSRDYNQFMDEHKAIANLEEGKYTTRFEPEVILFVDGTKLRTPE